VLGSTLGLQDARQYLGNAGRLFDGSSGVGLVGKIPQTLKKQLFGNMFRMPTAVRYPIPLYNHPELLRQEWRLLQSVEIQSRREQLPTLPDVTIRGLLGTFGWQ
jgi:hypothetical protein